MDAGYLATHGGTLVTQGTVESYEYRIFRLAGFCFNDTRVSGPINLQTRLQLYRETLPHVVGGRYFGLLDNSEGFENDFSLDAIRQLDRLLIDRGVRTYFGATVTKDKGYSKIVKLAQTNMETIGLDGAVIKVPDRATALQFICDRINEAAAERDHLRLAGD